MAPAGACHHNPVLVAQVAQSIVARVLSVSPVFYSVAQVAQTNDVTSPAWPLRNHGYLP